MRLAQHAARMGDRRGAHRVSVGTLKVNRPLGRPGRTWNDDIKMGLQEVEWGKDWIDLAQDKDRRRAFVNGVMNLRFPLNAGNFWTGQAPDSFAGRILLHGVASYFHHLCHRKKNCCSTRLFTL